MISPSTIICNVHKRATPPLPLESSAHRSRSPRHGAAQEGRKAVGAAVSSHGGEAAHCQRNLREQIKEKD